MIKNKILIITNQDDPHADGVIDLSIKNGCKESLIRFNTEHFLTNCKITFDNRIGFSMEFLDSEKTIHSSEIKSVWYRRPENVNLEHLNNDYVANFVKYQCKSFLEGLYLFSQTTSKWVNPIFSIREASYKVSQLVLAKKMGLKVPNSIITNVPQKVLDFYKEQKNISTKSIDAPNFVFNGCNYPMFNRRIKDISEITENLNSISICPTYFQEYIEKQFDIRVVIMGEEIYSFAIHSQDNAFSVEDFRGASVDLLKHENFDMPKEVKEKILLYMKKQKLLFSAMDFVLSKEGEYYFLENNPNGQWMWLEYASGFPLTEKMLNYLML